ncbi:unnamed protein product [Linum trigynum]|uniref:DUF4283 domain-containing protein n=1 Tax=Linum trigynum TaxID=586398 RepID=A0AAV2D8W6_9ROSI
MCGTLRTRIQKILGSHRFTSRRQKKGCSVDNGGPRLLLRLSDSLFPIRSWIEGSRVQSIWAEEGTIQVTLAKNGYFLVRFTSGMDYERAITGGPWLVGDKYLTVHQWTPEFNPYEHAISSTLVWARLLEIPIHYFHPVAVMRIGGRIGKPIHVDHATSMGARSDYARVCAQVDITKSLLRWKLQG